MRSKKCVEVQNPGWFPNTEFGFYVSMFYRSTVQHVEYHDDNDGTNAVSRHRSSSVGGLGRSRHLSHSHGVIWNPVLTRFYKVFRPFPNISLIDDMVYCLWLPVMQSSYPTTARAATTTTVRPHLFDRTICPTISSVRQPHQQRWSNNEMVKYNLTMQHREKV